MELPSDIQLPAFVYGVFKPGELAYQRIRPLVKGEPRMVTIRASLRIRDGLPLLVLDESHFVSGFLLHFQDSEALRAFEIIAKFEPAKQYRWGTIEIPGDGTKANTLIGRSPERASILFEETEWTGKSDPIFVFSLPLISEVAQDFGQTEFQSAPPDSFEWTRLFRLEMAYLLLWSAIERFCALSYGPDLDPMDKIRHLGNDESFKKALLRVVNRTAILYDSRAPENKERLNTSNPASSAKYYYLVRNNLSHRGKAAWRDGEIIRNALLELQEIFKNMLSSRFDSNSLNQNAQS